MSTKKYNPKIAGGLPVSRLHPSSACAGSFCCLHNPSDHHMVDWMLNLRASGLMERLCRHGIGHPDPDSLAWLKRNGLEGYEVHGCCGCCQPCTHGVVFDELKADGLDSYEIRRRWPRLSGKCPLGCGFSGIAYASYNHCLMGDW